MGAHIYNLKAGESGVKSFYHNLADTTSDILELLLNNPSEIHVSEFRDFVDQQKIEPVRSIEEYLIEYIMIGLYWQKYAGYASGLSKTVKSISDILYKARMSSKALKKPIDKLRTKLAHKHLIKKDNSYELVPIVENLARLIHWLDATKEFSEEVKRLKNWHLFLKSKSPIYISGFLSTNKHATDRFINMARQSLSPFTSGVKPFIENIKKRNKYRDDIIFCSRSEDEYLFIMIASEILNRAHKTEFNNSSKKIVLLPGCMSVPTSGSCHASGSKTATLQCGSCNTHCRINIIKGKLKKHNMDVRLISPDISFRKQIQYYASTSGVSVIAVTCILNILSCGLKMISAGVPAQLLFLDFCSCSKYRPDTSHPTEVNQDELFRKLDISTTRIPNPELILN